MANRVVVSGGGSPSDAAIDTTTVKPPVLSISAKMLNFGVSGSIITGPQTIELSFAPEVAVPWFASPDRAPNIVVSPSSGIGRGSFQVSVTGGPSASIIFGSEASNSPQFITGLITYQPPVAPFGSFD